MKKYLVLLMAVMMLCLLTACGCKHEWKEADCLNPKTCTLCDATEGEALGHSWTEATCERAKTCASCGETEGEALGHSWKEATCLTAKTCEICGNVMGNALGHSYGYWTKIDETSMERKCSVCGESERTELDEREMAMDQIRGDWMATLMSDDNGEWYTIESGTYAITVGEEYNDVAFTWEGEEYNAEILDREYFEKENNAGYEFTIGTDIGIVNFVKFTVLDGELQNDRETETFVQIVPPYQVYYTRSAKEENVQNDVTNFESNNDVVSNSAADSEEDERVIGTWEATTQYIRGEEAEISPVSMVMAADHSFVMAQDGDSRKGTWVFDELRTDFIPDTIVYQYYLVFYDTGDTYTVILYEHGTMQVLDLYGEGTLTNFEKIG